MTRSIGPGHPLRRFFCGLVEQVFMADLGLCSPRLTSYLSELLTGFIHVDAVYRLRTVDGTVIREVSRMHAEAYLGPGLGPTSRARLINRYIGDFTLFWAGIYPESLRPRHAGVDRLREYLLQGKRSYSIAGELSNESADPLAALLRQLSSEFECCVHGLRLVREGWDRFKNAPRPN